MSIAGHPQQPSVHPGDVIDPDRPITVASRDFPGPHRIERHRHLRAQLVHALAGVLTVSAEGRCWVVPTEQAVWVPAGVEHEVASQGPMTLRTLYIDPRSAADLPRRCAVLAMNPVMRALVLRFVADVRPERDPARRRLATVLLDELALLEPSPLDLPMPADPRLARVVALLAGEPGTRHPIGLLAARAGASERTLRRLFARETGMTLGAWRRRLRLQEAVSRLAIGHPVTRVALDLGYESVSAFVAMFRRELGAPPGRYIRAGRSFSADQHAAWRATPAAGSPSPARP